MKERCNVWYNLLSLEKLSKKNFNYMFILLFLRCLEKVFGCSKFKWSSYNYKLEHFFWASLLKVFHYRKQQHIETGKY